MPISFRRPAVRWRTVGIPFSPDDGTQFGTRVEAVLSLNTTESRRISRTRRAYRYELNPSGVIPIVPKCPRPLGIDSLRRAVRATDDCFRFRFLSVIRPENPFRLIRRGRSRPSRIEVPRLLAIETSRSPRNRT